MKSIIPHLSFGGHAELALRFYAEALGGRIGALMRLGEVMPGTPPDRRQQILHAELAAEAPVLFATDCTPEPGPSTAVPGITLHLPCDSVAEQDRVWARLQSGGTIRQPLHDTFYGGRLGALVDRFGVPWLLHFMPDRRE